MSSGSQREKLIIRRAYEAEGVSPAYENQPTKGPGVDIISSASEEDEKLRSNVVKWKSAQDMPLWRRMIGPSRRLVNDVESLFGSEASHKEDDIAVEETQPRQYEIMHSWVEESQNGEPTFYLNFVEKPLAQSRYDTNNVEWIHQREDVKSFGKFKRLFTSYATTDLVEGVDRLAIGLLKRVQSREEKRFFGGYYLGPCAARYDGQKPNDDDEDRPAWFINFPYFSLQDPKEISRHPATSDLPSREYPVRSLLQSRYRLEETEKRDSQQSVRKLSKHQANTCIEPWDARMSGFDGEKCAKIICIPQIWILSVHKEKLITSAPISDNELYGSTLLKKDLSEAPSNVGGLSLVRIIVEGQENKRYVYPINHCDWWFGLLEKHRQIESNLDGGKETAYDFFVRDKSDKELTITDRNWIEILRSVGLYRKQNSPVLEIRMKRRRRTTLETESSPPLVNWSDSEATFEGKDWQNTSRAKDRSIHPEKPSDTDHNHRRTKGLKTASNEPDTKSRVPFFEWPLRKSMRNNLERKRSVRLKHVLAKWLGNFMNDYGEALGSKTPCEDDQETAVEEVKSIEPRLLDQFLEDMARTIQRIESQIDEQSGDSRFAQINDIYMASMDLVSAFIPSRVVYGEQHSNDANESDRNSTFSVQSNLSEQSTSRVNATEPKLYASCVDHEAISLYRGILATIVAFIGNAPMTDEALKSFLSGCNKIMAEINRVHLGVFTLRASQLQYIGDDYSGVGVVQKVMITAFKEIMFLHLGLCRYLLSSSGPIEPGQTRDITVFTRDHVEKCCDELEDARKYLIAEAAEIESTPDMGPLVTAETVVILLLERLSKGVHQDGTADIIDLYEKVVEKLALDVETSASRNLLLEINKTSDELEIVGGIFKQQEKVLSLCHVLLDPGTFKNIKGRERLFKYESKSIETIRKATRERIADCDELKNRIVRLAKQNVQLVETQQDANNRAILVFTVVTIIFLPLSFVTDLFGMNLRGFVDTTDGAGHFWAIAIPLTVAIAVPCLILGFWNPLKRYGLKLRSKARK